VTSRILEFVMRSSVATHSTSITAPPLDDLDMVRLGAAHYDGGCAPCHGSPAGPNSPIIQRMLPPPPDPASFVLNWSNEQLFWIVKQGLKYTGMPGWVATERDDEVWSVIAFLRAYPDLDADQYAALSEGPTDMRSRSVEELARFGSGSPVLSACVRCHGDAEAGPSSRLVPKLAGQPREYLERALWEYAQGMRSSGIMQPVAAELDENAITELAAYYTGLADAPVSGLARAAPEQVARGGEIASVGAPDAGIPACLACHRGESVPYYPVLIGQHARYIVGQLHMMRSGVRSGTAQGMTMTAIARRLNNEQIEDVAAFFESLAPLEETEP